MVGRSERDMGRNVGSRKWCLRPLRRRAAAADDTQVKPAAASFGNLFGGGCVIGAGHRTPPGVGKRGDRAMHRHRRNDPVRRQPERPRPPVWRFTDWASI